MLGLCAFPAKGAVRERLLDWGPQIVLSLTPSEEMEALGGSDLPDILAARGIEWLHFPVVDLGTPLKGPGELSVWTEVTTTIRASLVSGGRVAVHCRAGCGRTGMVALRLMVETGEPAAAALERLRATRPCAVETDAQYRWATGG